MHGGRDRAGRESSVPWWYCLIAALATAGVMWAVDLGSAKAKLYHVAQLQVSQLRGGNSRLKPLQLQRDSHVEAEQLAAEPVQDHPATTDVAHIEQPAQILADDGSLTSSFEVWIQAFSPAKLSSLTDKFQCINGTRDEHHVCFFHNLALYNGTLFYIAGADGAPIPQPHMALLDEPPKSGQEHRIKLSPVFKGSLPFAWEEVEHIRQDVVLAVILWGLPNFYHIFGDFAASLHNTVCKYYGHCTYASRDKLRIFLQADVGDKTETETGWPPSAQEAYSCISQWPIMPLSHPDLRGKVVVIEKLLTGIGPDCRARKFCNGPDSPFGRGPAPVNSMLSWRHRLAECLGFDDTLVARSAPPKILLIDRPYSAGRHMLNVEEVVWRLERQYGKVTLHYMRNMTLREQAQLFSSASIMIQVHGAAIANWVFLPINAVAVHISHQNLYYGIHDWAEDMVRDLAAFNISFVPATNTNKALVETDKAHLFGYAEYWNLTGAQRLAVLEWAACPAAVPKVFQPTCAFMWIHLHSNLVVAFEMLDQAIETAMADLRSKSQQL